MSISKIRQDLENLPSQVESELKPVTQPNQLTEIQVKYLGKKGLITTILRQLGTLSEEERPQAGKLANEVKAQIEELISRKKEIIQNERQKEILLKETVDITLPGRAHDLGKIHPITKTINEISQIFLNLGFQTAEGPEVETDYYNFEALNIPSHHPARDMHDTFYTENNFLLRTHTSPVQIRTMEKQEPPIRIIAPGKVYRCDADITHSPMFHQIEGLLVDKNVTFGDLKGILKIFLETMFGKTAIRFRPSFFPFTEPSAEVDIACVICQGKGCRVCKSTGWLEIMGCGMVDPNVFKMVKYDPEIYSGLAFGMGIERIAMLKYGVDDIRLFYENDLRFLKQF